MFSMKKTVLTTVALLGINVVVSGTALAADHSGVITLYHLNGGISGRDACVRMVPALPGTGWACVYNSNLLRSQIATLLRDGYEQGKQCHLFWANTAPEGHANISVAECGATQ
jgi:hypothetical protein